MKTLYTTFAKDGTVRMSAEPMPTSPRISPCTPPRPTRGWPRRVLYWAREAKHLRGEWVVSCRCAAFDDREFFFDSENDAINWLVEEGR